MLEIQPFRTPSTDVASFGSMKTGVNPTIEKPQNPFDRKIFFVFLNGREAMEAAESYMRNEGQFRQFFETYRRLKDQAIAVRPFVKNYL